MVKKASYFKRFKNDIIKTVKKPIAWLWIVIGILSGFITFGPIGAIIGLICGIYIGKHIGEK